MKELNKVVKIIAKVLEIVHWVAAGLMVAAAICSTTASQYLGHFIDMNALETEAEASVYGFEVALRNSAGELNTKAFMLFAIGAVILYALVAMIFRNIYLIIKKSESETPFSKDNIRMLKEIGIFSIAIPVIGLIMSTIIRLVVGVDAIEISVKMYGFVMGIIILCLTQFFAYGAKLEKDVDGLL
ncbi:MAG: DUF2975 domain-containing protein [Oscillospiraceae bacterium]|nr:DUF2975 domain-containing protein [Oscillospiraceae bacterium]